MMTRRILVLISICGAVVGHAEPATPPPRTPAPTPLKSPQSLRGRLNYKPVGLGFPMGRVDAGSRGDSDEVASLYVIAPENAGLTTRSEPLLYWFQTAPARLPFEISLLKPNDPTPVLRVRRTSTSAASPCGAVSASSARSAGRRRGWKARNSV